MTSKPKSNNNNGKSKASTSSSTKKTGGSSSSKTEQWVILLMGFPGAGKSHIAKQLETKYGYVRINQDELGTCDECKKLLAKALRNGKSVCIDRCNIHPKERKMWINETRMVLDDKSFRNFDLIWVSTSVDECKRRAKERRNHPTLDTEKADEVIDEFARGFKPPQPFEGYVNLFDVSDTASGNSVLLQIATRSIKSK